jgi:hypothetical protein
LRRTNGKPPCSMGIRLSVSSRSACGDELAAEEGLEPGAGIVPQAARSPDGVPQGSLAGQAM